MKRLFPLLLLGLMLVPCRAAEDATDLTPRSPTSSSTLAIVGPGEAIDAGEEVYLRIQGLTLAEVVEAQDAQLFDLTAFPLAGVKIKASYDWMFRTLDLEFRAKHEGEYLVKLHLVRAGKLEIAAIVVSVGVNPNPEPDPKPDPDPDPTPPPPLAEMWVIVVEETSQRTPEQARVLLDPTVRQWMAKNQHRFRILDKDQTSADLQPWINRATAQPGIALPRLFISDSSGVVYFDGELPHSWMELLELVKKWGAER